MNALTTAKTHALASPSTITFTPDQVDLIKRTICKGATDDELALFLGQCQRTGLDPFSRQIHAVKRWDPDSKSFVMGIQVGIDGFRLIADRHKDDDGSRDYAGQVGPFWCGKDRVWHDVWVGPEEPVASRVGVLRKGFSEPVYGTAHWVEYVQTKRDGTPNSMWVKMVASQLSKCAEALALRKAFPNDLSGLYTPDEMGQAENSVPLDKRKEVAPAGADPLKDPPAQSPLYLSKKKAMELAARATAAGFTDAQIFGALGDNPERVTAEQATAFFALVSAEEGAATSREAGAQNADAARDESTAAANGELF